MAWGLFIRSILLISSLVAVVAYIVPSQLPLLQHGHRFDAAYFDQRVEHFIEERNITGLSVALTHDDRLIYARGFGYADVENKVKVSVHDRFRVASVSKAITAIAIMCLVQEGRLRVEDFVLGDGSILGDLYSTKWYSDWERNITVQNLLEHSPGYVNADMCGEERDLEGGCDPTIFSRLLDLDQWQLVSALLDQYSPSRPPGTFASYSNFGFFIAGRVIETVSKVFPYHDYVQDAVLRPLGITNMTLARDEIQQDEVKYYDPKHPDAPYNFNIHRRDSVGAWIATPIDLTKIMTAINGLPGREDLLNETTLQVMFQESSITNSSYAKGFTVRSDDQGLIDVAKDGGSSGARSFVNINFRNKTTYAIVVNSEMPTDQSRGFHDGHDLKVLMDNLTWPIQSWPSYNLYAKYGG